MKKLNTLFRDKCSGMLNKNNKLPKSNKFAQARAMHQWIFHKLKCLVLARTPLEDFTNFCQRCSLIVKMFRKEVHHNNTECFSRTKANFN
jgi:hypothetical protein